MKGVIKFLKETREEIKKVNWPTKKETVKYAVIVLFTSFAVALYLGGVDYLISMILERVI